MKFKRSVAALVTEPMFTNTSVSSRLKRGTGLLAALIALLSPVLAISSPAEAVAANAVAVNTANWSGSAGFGSQAPAWYTDSSGPAGHVHLQGAARQTSASGANANLLGTLPVAARPARNVYTIVHTFAGTYADLSIGPNGQIVLIDPRRPALADHEFVSLEGITYQTTDPGNPIAVNTANWSGSAGFGSQAPAWAKDASGIVHLQGAAQQTSASGASANLLGTLPIAARPVRNVYTIVHTFAGTYADLSIGSNGQIFLIDPAFLTIGDLFYQNKDYRFVSLEAISYQQ